MEKVLEGKRIFLVEDDLMNLSVFSTSLKAHGALIEQDVFGYGIVEHIKMFWPFDIIILDIVLRRGLSGYDVLEQLRKHPIMKDVPVVVVTSLSPETEIPKAKAKGANGFISKPINAIEFPKQLATVLNGNSVWITSR